MRLEIAAQTDKGRRKANNEDNYGVYRVGDVENLRFFDEGALLCVADGLGGHIGGEIASKLAVSILRDMLKTSPADIPNPAAADDDEATPLPAMCEWVKRANANVYQTNQDLVTAGKPMGTTLLAALVQSKKVYIANVGDSRCYHIREGEFLDKTEDHSWVDEQVKLGLMSKAEAEVDQRKNIVTRSIGTHESVDVDSYTWHIVPGDTLLLCTDGLINMVKDKDILEEFRKGGTAAEIAQRLVHMANENGGKDNITVVIAHISPNVFRTLYFRFRALKRRHGALVLWILLTILAAAGSFTLGYYLGLKDVLGIG